MLTGADCAETRGLRPSAIDSGTVLVINGPGRLRQSERPYDRLAAGVPSGAG